MQSFKRKINILLILSIISSLISTNLVWASSSNRVNKTITVKDGKPVKGVYLLLEPDNEVTSDSSIVITVTNSEYISQEAMDGTASVMDEGYEEGGYQWHEDRIYETGEYVEREDGSLAPQLAVETLNWEKVSHMEFDSVMSNSSTGDLPYNLKRIGRTEMEVQLFNIPYDRVNVNTASGSKIRYKIPIPVIADGEGTIKAKIDSNSTTISDGEYDIATVTDDQGTTSISIDEVNTGVDSIALEMITIKESVSETFELDKLVKLRLSSGFLFESGTMFIEPGINCDFRPMSVNVPNEDEVEFYWPSDFTYTGSEPKPASIRITGLKVVPEDEDNDWGQVSITIKGGGCTTETILCAERTDYGFDFSADGTDLINGRRQNGDFDEELFKSGLITIAETTPGSFIPQRKLSLTVPEGVHIFDIELDDADEISIKSLAFGDGYCQINDDGDKISFIDLPVNEEEISTFSFYLYLTADAGYVGEVPCHIEGGGIEDNTIEDVIIANFSQPVEVSAPSTIGSVGKMFCPTGNITIKETKETGLLEDGRVIVAVDSVFGIQELALCDNGSNNITVEVIEGDLRIENVKHDEGYISFDIKRESTEPSTIEIKNVAIGTTRAVPYGVYGLKIYGSGVLNNFSEDSDALGRYGWSCDTKKYVVPSYFTIEDVPEGTDASTLDVVRVFIDKPTMYVNYDEYNVGVAPYIQKESNSTLVPLRCVSVALCGDTSTPVDKADDSARVVWDNEKKTATIFVGQGIQQRIIQFQNGSNRMQINSSDILMDNGVKAEIKDDRMYVPFRALGSALGTTVDWYEELRMAVYNDDGSPWPPEEKEEPEVPKTTGTQEVKEDEDEIKNKDNTVNKEEEKKDDNILTDDDITVYVDDETMLYHVYGCPENASSKTMQLSTAKTKKYKPCDVCQ